MSSWMQDVSGAEQERKSLPRDENRFRYFYPNGKPILPEDAAGYLTVKTSYERVCEAESAQ
jgi:hypothetical protein